MKTDINHLVPKVREKLATCVSDIRRYKDEVLSSSIKLVIDTKMLHGKRYSHVSSMISPEIKENSREEQELILRTCLLFQLPPEKAGRLEAELHEAENGEKLFSGQWTRLSLR